MKKIYTLLVAALTMLGSAHVGATDITYTFNWAHSIDGATSAGDNIIDQCMSSDGYYFIGTDFGSADKDLKFGTKVRNVNYDGEALLDGAGNLIEGSPYNDGTSYNRNMLLQKVDKEGKEIWNVYTKKGDVDQESVMAATNDGGLVLAIKTRAWVKEAGYDNLLEIVDAQGAVTTIKDMGTHESEYRMVLVRLDTDGKVVWTRLITGEYRASGTTGYSNYDAESKYKQNTALNFYVKGIAIDDDQNIYLAGNYRTTLSLKNAKGETVTFSAMNAQTWTGDSQVGCGDLFLLKLDSNGYYTNGLFSTSTATAAYMDKLVYADGKIYANGRISGDGNNFLLGDKTITPEKSHETMYVASINASDLSVNYATTVAWATGNAKWGIHNKCLQCIDGVLYSSGGVQGSFACLANTTNMYKGYVLALDAASGEIKGSALYNTKSISECFGVAVGQTKVFAAGYQFSGAGGIVVPIDKTTFAAEEAVGLMTYGTSAVGACPIQDGANIVFMNRGGKANATTNEVTFTGTDTKFSNLTAWGVAYYSYKVSDLDTATGVEETNAAEAKANVNVYTADGIEVKSNVSAANATNGLKKGVYVVGNQKVVVE